MLNRCTQRQGHLRAPCASCCFVDGLLQCSDAVSRITFPLRIDPLVTYESMSCRVDEDGDYEPYGPPITYMVAGWCAPQSSYFAASVWLCPCCVELLSTRSILSAALSWSPTCGMSRIETSIALPRYSHSFLASRLATPTHLMPLCVCVLGAAGAVWAALCRFTCHDFYGLLLHYYRTCLHGPS
jgi:hypothetical protein